MAYLDLATDGQYLGALSRLRARVSLAELVGPERRAEVDAINWQLDPWAIGKATVALHREVRVAARGAAGLDPEIIRRAALVDARGWEALASVEDRASAFGALINSAVGYELAGYQANATCVARAAERRLGQRPSPSLSLAASAFVQRQFLRLGPLAAAMNRPPDLAAVFSGVAISGEFEDTPRDEVLLAEDDLAHFVAQAFAVQALDAAGRYFLSGIEDHLGTAGELLDIACDGFAASGSVREGNLVANLQALLPVMHERSTWSALGAYFDGNVRWTRYLRVLARGLGRVPRDSRSISELWPSQQAAVDGGLLDSHASIVLRMPTSAGKTRVAELAIVHSLLSRPDRSCLYIAPFRALADEVEASLDAVLGEVGLGASSIVGGPETIGVEEILAAESQVLVLTPEKADLLMRVRPDLVDSVGLVVLDEGHIVGDERRGPQFEMLVSRLRRRLPDARFLFLSAVVPDETLEDFARWLGAAQDTGILRSGWRPAIQRVASFEWTAGGGTLRYRRSSAGGDEVSAFERFLPRLIPDRPFMYINPQTRRSNTRRFPDPSNRSQLIAGLAYEFANTGPVLMFCPQTNFAEACAKALQTRIELAELVDEPVPSWFTRRRYPSAEVAAVWLGEDDTVTKLLRYGVGVHHGRLPDSVRRAVEDDFRAGRLRVLAATNTLGQGVNLPVRSVLVHSVRRRDDEGRETRLPARDYWNIAGRAGRAGFETDGLVVHLVLNSRDRRDFNYFLAKADDVEPVYSSLFRVLADLVNQRISSPEALAELDPGLMALLVEEGEGRLEATVAAVEPLLRGSLVGVQAERYDQRIEPLIALATAGAASMAENLPFGDLFVFARTGLSSASCVHLQQHAAQRREVLVAGMGAERVTQDLIVHILDGLAGVPEMQPERPFDGNYDELVMEWIAGLPVPDIAQRLTPHDQAPMNIAALARAIEEVGSYLLPWGFSAYLQIAEHTLGVAPTVEVAALPGLVKYGVPAATAAWAMGFGVTTRTLGMSIAAEYADHGGPSDPASLREWLTHQDPVQLAGTMNVSSDLLVELAAVLERTRRPRLSADLQRGPILPRSGYVAVFDEPGVTLAVAKVREGDAVQVVRDHESSLDRNSLQVVARGEVIGMLDPASSAVLAIEIDAGLEVEATVTERQPTTDGLLLTLQLTQSPVGTPQ